MLKVYETPEDCPTPPECRATVERIQRTLDGAPAETLDTDPHTTACSACRERVRAARVLLSVLALPSEPVAVPAGFAERIVKAVGEDRHVQTRRRVYRTTAWLTLAATVLIAVYGILGPKSKTETPANWLPSAPREVAQQPNIAPAPREKTPDPQPMRMSDALASTGQAILDAPKPLADSVAVAPKLFDVLRSPFTAPAPPADPMGTALEPARKSLAELPVAARTGLEPVTGTAEKAFARFLRDVGSVKPNS